MIRSLPLPLLALARAAFAIGTTEFVIMGLLPAIAVDLRVDLPDADLLVTGCALGVAFGAPPLTALAAKASQRHLRCAQFGSAYRSPRSLAFRPNIAALGRMRADACA